jgi:hypothetical protein
MLTDGELAQQILAREDSVEMLRAVLAAPRPQRDSLVAALLLGGDDPFRASAEVPGSPADSAARAQGQPPVPGPGQAPAAQARVPPSLVAPPQSSQPPNGRAGSTPPGEPSGTPVRPDSGPPPSRPDTLGARRPGGGGGGPYRR